MKLIHRSNITSILAILICTLGISITHAQSPDSTIKTVTGKVVRQIPGCEADGFCTVVVKTNAGEEEFIWNNGFNPDADCSFPEEVTRTAPYLRPGDKVEIRIPFVSGNVLCGKGSAVKRLDMPATPLKIIRGFVTEQNRGCGEHRSKPCSVVVRTDQGLETLAWMQFEKDHPDCRPGIAAHDALMLEKGDKVEIHVPISSNNALCGDGAEVIKLDK